MSGRVRVRGRGRGGGRVGVRVEVRGLHVPEIRLPFKPRLATCQG